MARITDDSIVGLDWENGVKSIVVKRPKGGFTYRNDDDTDEIPSGYIFEDSIEALIKHSEEKDEFSFKTILFDTEEDRLAWFEE